MSNHIYFAQRNQIGVIWIEGAGTHENVQSFRDALVTLNEAQLEEIIFEMHGCYHLDSTFMGVIAKENRIHKEKDHESYIVSQVQSSVSKEMQTLGLNHLLYFQDRPLSVEWLSARKEVITNTNKEERTIAMHEAHVTLSELSELNKNRFQEVIQQLAKKLGL